MTWWRALLIGWLVPAFGRCAWFIPRVIYLTRVRRALADYHLSIGERRESSREEWLRRQRLAVQSLLFQSGQYDDAPSPREGGRATKLNLYALESLEHWLSEHPRGMARAREALDRAI